MKLYYTLPLLLAGLVALSGCSSSTTEQPVEEIEQQASKKTDSSNSEETSEESTEEKDSTEMVETTTADIQFVETNFECISFVLPENAEPIDVGEQPLPVLAVYLNPTTKANLNVVAEELPEPMNVEEYIDYVIEITGEEFVSNKTYESNDLQWNETISVIDIGTGDAHLVQRTIIHDDIAYIFSFSARAETVDSDIEIFDHITSSVTIIE
ncbi:hypothetical protein [Ureibacillus acetophenoni]|uniref:Lipoprotein n=1 Tax=Ureibacillus acetophenoni TaxID=614649 RepID=A0A285UMU5_9BACL|nr:hypothetical protein [Ureibacillus acetophenoni]SOC43224.1 hypothetical protein SAMN05877842_11523 [Ureibacillus acetophenoni]